jgi:hypothetical protein
MNYWINEVALILVALILLSSIRWYWSRQRDTVLRLARERSEEHVKYVTKVSAELTAREKAIAAVAERTYAQRPLTLPELAHVVLNSWPKPTISQYHRVRVATLWDSGILTADKFPDQVFASPTTIEFVKQWVRDPRSGHEDYAWVYPGPVVITPSALLPDRVPKAKYAVAAEVLILLKSMGLDVDGLDNIDVYRALEGVRLDAQAARHGFFHQVS